jgi:hypothetical protein
MNELTKVQEEFKSFSINTRLQTAPSHRYGNIIKGESNLESQPSQDKPYNTESTSAPQPEIIIHKDGETIKSIEFVCTCGQKTEVRFDYLSE